LFGPSDARRVASDLKAFQLLFTGAGAGKDDKDITVFIVLEASSENLGQVEGMLQV